MPKKVKSSKTKSNKNARHKAPTKSVKRKIASLSKKTTKPAKAKGKPEKRPVGKPVPKAPPKPTVVVRAPSKQFAGAVAALEIGIKLMYAEDFAKAVKAFQKVITDYQDEPEIQASAKARIQACEKKLQEKARTVYKTADDHYNVAVALMNSGDLDTAMSHLQSALKLSPRADHVLYALAAANALRGNKDQALTYLKQSIHHRAENRFQAIQDNDFAVLAEEQAFRDLVTPPEK